MKKLKQALPALILCAALAGCSSPSSSLAPSSAPSSTAATSSTASVQTSSTTSSSAPVVNEEELKTLTLEILTLVNERNYSAITTKFREDLASQLTPETLSTQMDTLLDALGAFVEFGDFTIVQQEDPTYGPLNIAMQNAKFANETITWVVVFDANNQLLSLTLQEVK